MKAGRIPGALFVAAALLLAAGRTEAAPILVAQSSTLFLRATTGLTGGPSDTRTDSDSQVGTTNPLSVSVVSVSSGTSGFVRSRGSASATWASPDSGTFRFEDLGWDDGTLDGGSGGGASIGGNPVASYTFTALVDADFTVDYSTTATATSPSGTFGLQPFRIRWNGVEVGNTGLNNVGSLSLALSALNTYTLEILSNSNIGFPSSYSGSTFLDGSITFQATPTAVPEPTAFLLFGSSVLTLAVARRRRS